MRHRPLGTRSGRSKGPAKEVPLKAPTPKQVAQFPEALQLNQRMFLAAYVNLGSVTHAAQAVKMVRQNHRRWMKESEEYKKAFEMAKRMVIETLEGVVHQFACKGNMLAAIFKLKALKPDMYRDPPRTIVNNVPSLPGKDKGINLDELPQKLREGLLEFIRQRDQPKVN